MTRNPLPRAAHVGLALTGSLGLIVGAALAQSLPARPATWTRDRLAQATYVILDPQIRGNQNLIDAGQRQGVLRAMRKDSGDALKRHYPQAVISAGTPGPDAIRVTPVMDVPGALLPWSKLSASLTFDLPDGTQVVMLEQFGLLTLWQRGSEAANYAFDQIAQHLP